MTYGEVCQNIEAYKTRIEMEQKQRAVMDYKLADLIGISCGRIMDSKAKMPTIDKVYSSLFSQEEVQAPVRKQTWEEQKDILMRYATAHNKKVGGD